MTTVRELTTKLGFEVDSTKLQAYEKGLQNVRRTMLQVAAAGAAIAGSLFGITKSVANTADEIAKTSRELGISSDVLQEYRYAADLAGISNESLDKSLRLFSRSVGQAAQGTGVAAQQFEYLGISLYDAEGRLKSNDVLLEEVGQKLEGVEDASIRAAISQDLFGRSGQRLGVLISQNREELEKQRKTAHEYGLVLSQEVLANSEEFNDRLSDAEKIVRSFGQIIAAELLPRMTEIIKAFIEFVQANRELIKTKVQDFLDGLISFLKALWAVLSAVNTVFQFFAQFVGGAENALKLLFATMIAFKTASFIKSIIDIVSALRGFSIAAVIAQLSISPIVLAIAAVTAAVIALIYYWDELDLSLPDWVLDSWNAFIDTVKAAFGWVKDLFGFFGDNTDQTINTGTTDQQTASRSDLLNRARGFSTSPQTQDLMNAGRVGGDFTPVPPGALTNNMSSREVNVNSNIQVTVPPGSTSDQVAFLKQAAQQSFKEEYVRHLQNVLYNNPQLE